MPRQLPCAQGSRRGRGRVRRPPDMRHATNALATPKIGSHLAQILQALEEGGVLRCRPRYTYAQRGCREVAAFGLLPCGSSAKCAMPHGWLRAFLPTARPKQTAARLAPSLGTAKSDTTTHTHKARATREETFFLQAGAHPSCSRCSWRRHLSWWGRVPPLARGCRPWSWARREAAACCGGQARCR